MSNVFKFPDLARNRQEDNPFSGVLPPLLGRPAVDVMERVFAVNFDLLGVEYSVEVVDSVHIYIDPRYQDKILADIDNMAHRPEIRGLYCVDLDSYELIKINDEPLKYFLNN